MLLKVGTGETAGNKTCTLTTPPVPAPLSAPSFLSLPMGVIYIFIRPSANPLPKPRPLFGAGVIVTQSVILKDAVSSYKVGGLEPT